MSHKCRAYSISGIGRGKINQKEIRQAFYKGWDMASNQIIELAKQAGAAKFYPERQAVTPDAYLVGQDFLQRFAELVRNQTLEEEKRKRMSFAELHPANPDAKCKCEHWQSCKECHPTAHKD